MLTMTILTMTILTIIREGGKRRKIVGGADDHIWTAKRSHEVAVDTGLGD